VTKYEWVVPARLADVDYDEILRKQIDVLGKAQREGAEVRITAFDDRQRVGHVTSLEAPCSVFDPDQIAAMRVHIDDERFRHSASVPDDGTWEGVPRPFKKIEVWEGEQKKRPKSAMKTGKRPKKQQHQPPQPPPSAEFSAMALKGGRKRRKKSRKKRGGGKRRHRRRK